ncbi:MAG: chemotaxis protein CheB [Rhodocyclaceae bacterium]|nr:chemotaxis protein CheB [Rhodocyclaceae bacterium]
MNVSLQEQDHLSKISVLGQVDSPDEWQELIAACARCTAGPDACEIYFFDAYTLPGEVIEALAAHVRAGHKLKLYACESFLVHSLARLGLSVHPLPGHARQPGLNEVAALAIGGSAESLSRILYIVERLPVGQVAIFIVQHILEDQRNLLDDLLRVRTEYEVVMPTQLMPVRPGTIYIAPPGHHMKVANGLVYLTRDRKVQFARPAINLLFQSVAAEYGNRAVGVLLCGYGQDGVEGCAEMRRKEGCVLVEEGDECDNAQVLPDAARTAGAYDYLLDVRGLACFLGCLIGGRTSQPSPDLLELFLEALHSRYGYDFRGYQHGTLERRVDKLIRLMGERDFFDFQREVLTDATAFQHFFMEMSINVTSFFRHPEQFRLLREEVLPYLETFPLIKIWSAGCATGEEAYSLAFLMDELGILDKTYLFATDMNPHVLRQAEAGLFPVSCLNESRENCRQVGCKRGFDDFVENVEGMYLRVPERIRRRILFHHHSLVHDGVFNEFQLIVCRNVLIYFAPPLQQKVMERFANSLHRDGFLMLGPSESLDTGEGGRWFAAYRGKLKVYRWR